MATSIITINSLIDIFNNWADAKAPLINDFGFGPIWDFGTSRQMKYPCMWVDLETTSSVSVTNKSMVPQYSMIFMFLDKENIQDNVDNINGLRSNNVGHIMSDTFQLGQDFINDLVMTYNQQGIVIVNDVLASKVYDETTDKVYGWSFSITLRTPYINCAANILPTCKPVIIKNSNDAFNISVASGDTYILPDTPVIVKDQNDNILTSGNLPSVTGGIIGITTDCLDATANLKDEDGNDISSTDIPSGTSQNITAPNGTVVIKNTDNTTLYIQEVLSAGSVDKTINDSNITLNGNSFLDVAAEQTEDVILTDQNDIPIIPISVVGNTIKVDVPDTSIWWTRNPDWVALPTIVAGDNKFAGVAAVYENDDLNYYYLSGWTSLNWGDGTTDVALHQFIYSTISGPVLIDADGLNYKTVLVTANLTSGTLTFQQTFRSYNWLDILLDGTLLNSNFLLNYQSAHLKLERLQIRNIGSSYIALQYLRSLKVFTCDNFTASNDLGSPLRNSGNFRDNNGDPTDFNFSTSTTLQAGFVYSSITKVGTITALSATTASGLFLQSQLSGTLKIVSSSSLALINSLCEQSGVEHLEITDCSGVSNTDYFAPYGTLQSCILTGLTIGFNISNQKMSATALNDMFTSLGNASGTQTIIITGNVGAATCDTSIATSKGYTVTI